MGERTSEQRPRENQVLWQHLRKIEKQNAQYLSLFNQLPQGIFIYHLEDLDNDATLRLVAANPAVQWITGAEPQDIVGKTLDENFPELREQSIPHIYSDVVRTGNTVAFEMVYRDDHVIESAFAVRAFPLPGHCVGVSFDTITLHKQAEDALEQLNAELEQRVRERTEELRLREQLLHTVMDSSPAAMYLKDLNGRFLLVNKQTSALLGLSPEAMQGKLDTELFPLAFAMQWRANEQQAIDAGEPISLEETVNQEDGLHTFLSVRMPMYDESGAIHAIAGIATDITERKQMENAFYAQRERYRSLVESIDDWIWEVNADGLYAYSSPGVIELLGYTPEEMIGKSPFDFMPPDEAERVAIIFQVALQQQQPLHRFENRLLRKDGCEVIVETNGVPFFAADGTMCGYRGIDHDVTAQRRMEADRAALQQQIIDAQREALRELSTPLIPLSDTVMMMPLIGTIDSGRAQQVMETLLDGVARQRASMVILDITGVSVVDTQVAQAIIQTAQAVRLLGAKMMLTGIRPQIAQTLVHLGVDLSGIITRGSLQAGIAAALR
ncbi:MAG: PAS domain S-box protein [Chloroflexaceae bacterium]|nr:PAS domain S-box protein [Chloroflexaceae bacterium]